MATNNVTPESGSTGGTFDGSTPPAGMWMAGYDNGQPVYKNAAGATFNADGSPHVLSPGVFLLDHPNTTSSPTAVVPAAPAAPAPGGSGPSGSSGDTGNLIGSLTGTPPPAAPSGTPDYIPPTPVFTPPPDFQAPTIEQALNNPGYQFQLQQGQNAIQNAAAAKGTLNDSGTFDALSDYNRSAAQSDYQNVYNNMLGEYNTKYQAAKDQFAPIMTAYNTQAQAGQYQQNATYQDKYSAWLAQMGLTQEQIQDLLAGNQGTTVNFSG